MSYIVLARKHRPQDFDELIGQEHVATVLKKAIAADRVAHSYLFCGPRGVGKTSCARILAKCLNDEKGPTTKPDHTSSICQEIAKGTSFDVLEIDGASNRGIDEIRALRENVKFAPTYGRYKIYIVDEVHMLTTEAFNALLKTLEEPPEHVKFIFATTDPNKVPATILSRCQRFDFKLISLKTIVETLKAIAKKEKFKIDDDALYAVAKAANGSMRDALSVFDQVSALSSDDINAEQVFSMLGLVETDLLFGIVEAIGEKNCAKALQALEEIVDKGKDVRQLLKDLTEHFRHLMVIKVGGKALGKLVDYPVAIKEMFLKQTELFSLADILKAIDVFIETQSTARVTESIRMPLEVAIAKLTYQGEDFTMPRATAPRSSAKPAATSRILKDKRGEVHLGPESNNKKEKQNEILEEDVVDELVEGAEDKTVVDIERVRRGWDALTHATSKEKMSVATFLQEGSPLRIEESLLIIGFPKDCSLHKESLESKDNIEMVQRIFSEKLCVKIGVKYEITDIQVSLEEEEAVQSTLDAFGGEVVNRWHNE